MSRKPGRLVIRRLLNIACALALCAASLDAQIVRGVVTERNTGAPLPGVLMSLERPDAADSTAAINALTNDRGEFAIRARGPGRWRLTAKRIGVQRYASAPFTLADGEARHLDVVLDIVTQVLPTVAVVEAPQCLRRSDQAMRLASLWDEVRTALTATQISARDRLVRANVYRYVRHLDPESRRVLDESRSEAAALTARPFTSLGADTLTRLGWWYERGGVVTYHAPDENVLLSRTFLRDHCFGLVTNDRSGLDGIAFEPAPGRAVPDIRGTIWIDARTFELHSVEFAYTRLPAAAAAGGVVRFARLPNGTWIVRRWHVRMPQYAQYTSFEDAALGRPNRAITVLRAYRTVEEGGTVFVEGVPFYQHPATVTGTVLDSLGRPLTGTSVRLAGSPYEQRVDDHGQFRFDSLPAGNYAVVAEHPGYRSFGMLAADATVDVDEGETRDQSLRAANADAIVAHLCDGKRPGRNRATLRVLLLNQETMMPLRRVPLHLYWTARADGRSPDGIQRMTDNNGAAVYCDVPSRVNLYFRLLLPTLEPGPIIATCTLERGEVTARMVTGTPPMVAAQQHFQPDTTRRTATCQPFPIAAERDKGPPAMPRDRIPR